MTTEPGQLKVQADAGSLSGAAMAQSRATNPTLRQRLETTIKRSVDVCANAQKALMTVDASILDADADSLEKLGINFYVHSPF